MTTEAKLLIGTGLATILIIAGGAFLFTGNQAAAPVEPSRLVRDHSYSIGSDAAPVTLVEFADFQCPTCAAAHPVVQQLKADFPDQLRFVFRHFPLESIHPNARLAALAAEAAGQQNKFWEMHNLLLERQGDWSGSEDPAEKFTAYAGELGLSVDQFLAALTEEEFSDRIADDLADAQSLQLRGTPTFFINGQLFTGQLSYDNLRQAIAAEL